MAVILTAAFPCARLQIPTMLERNGGTLLFTGSFVGCGVELPEIGAFGAAKADLLDLVREIIADYGAAGI